MREEDTSHVFGRDSSVSINDDQIQEELFSGPESTADYCPDLKNQNFRGLPIKLYLEWSFWSSDCKKSSESFQTADKPDRQSGLR